MAANSCDVGGRQRLSVRYLRSLLVVACLGILLTVAVISAGRFAEAEIDPWKELPSTSTNWRQSAWVGYGSRVEKSFRIIPAVHDYLWPPPPISPFV